VPTYAYACTECGHAFDAVQKFSDDALTTCPECEGRLRKVYTSIGVSFKGSGFYRNDSRAAGPNGSKGSEKGSEKGSDKGSEKADKGSEKSTEKKSSEKTGTEKSTPAPAAASGSSGTSGSSSGTTSTAKAAAR
jgi:putative FmdB family regulatory protein